MRESFQRDESGVILSEPPQSSVIAAQARGANSEAGNVWWPGMLVRSVCQVDLSFGFMPRRVQTEEVTLDAWAGVNAPEILGG